MNNKNFKITLNNNIKLGELDTEDCTISDAIDSTFTNLEYFILKWNNSFFQINYRLDIADSIYDIIKMLESIKRKERHHKIIFPSQHFFESWELHTIDGVICIKWNDDEIPDVVTIESILYIKEWLKLLQQIHDCLLLVGYNNENSEDFHLLENLERIS